MRFPFKTGLTSLLLAAGMIAAPAMAGDYGHNNRGGHASRDYRHDGYRGGYRDHGRHDYRAGYRGGYRQPPRVVYRPAPRPVIVRPAPRVAYHGAPHWSRGARYYDRGYGPTYVVNNYGYYGLRAPPRGYYWRRSDAGDFLLVAVATGIITDLILNH